MTHPTSFAYTSPFFVTDMEEFQDEISKYDVEIKEEYDEIRLTSPTGQWEMPSEIVETIQRYLPSQDGFAKISQVDVDPRGFCVVKTLAVAPDHLHVIDGPDMIDDAIEVEEVEDFFSEEGLFGFSSIADTEDDTFENESDDLIAEIEPLEDDE